MSESKRLMQYDAQKKSAGVGYALWFFLGMLGAHRFYVGKVGSGVLILLLTIGAWVLTAGIGLVIPGLWVFIDLFLIGGWVKEHNERLANTLG